MPVEPSLGRIKIVAGYSQPATVIVNKLVETILSNFSSQIVER